MSDSRGVELVGAILEQGQAEPVDATQRRTQIVGHRIAEGFQIAVRALGRLLGRQQLARGRRELTVLFSEV